MVVLAEPELLPPAFRERIQGFRRRSRRFGEFARLEVFVCRQAMVVVRAALAVHPTSSEPAEFVDDFYAAGGVERVTTVPAFSHHEHGATTLAWSCFLARLYLARRDLVARAHGAFCEGVGCAAYGCSPEARRWSGR